MYSRSRTNIRTATLLVLAASVAGCSDIYTDRRDMISIAAGEAMAANRVTHTIDPWSPASANRHIAYNGERLQGAAERYRRHRVIRPVSPGTSDSASPPHPPPPLTTEAVPIPAQDTQSAPRP